MNPNDTADLHFAFRGRDLIVLVEGAEMRVPSAAEWAALDLPVVREHDLGRLDGPRCLAIELAADVALPNRVAAIGLRRVWSHLGEASYRRAGRAVQIVAWGRDHQFCGRCGGPTDRVDGETSRRCSRCRVTLYPRISPAIIVLVTRGESALLGRSTRFPMPMYSTLAGFVEAGETLEEAVSREIREEAGIEVRDIRYFGSQPWPFPDSLMIGFTAEHASGEARADPAELSDVGWFTADALPPVPPRISIARAMIDDWVRRMGGDPDRLDAPRLPD